MGAFVVYDDQVDKAMEEDGVPRYEVSKRSQFLKKLESCEISNDGATLYLKPDPVSFMYYMNSCEPRIEDTHMQPSRAFVTHAAVPLDFASTKSLLKNASEGVVFTLSHVQPKRGKSCWVSIPFSRVPRAWKVQVPRTKTVVAVTRA